MTYRLLRRAIYFPSEGMFIPYKGLEKARFIRLKDISYLGETEMSYNNSWNDKVYIPLPKKETEKLLLKVFNRK